LRQITSSYDGLQRLLAHSERHANVEAINPVGNRTSVTVNGTTTTYNFAN
jgi:hypothetical protein